MLFSHPTILFHCHTTFSCQCLMLFSHPTVIPLSHATMSYHFLIPLWHTTFSCHCHTTFSSHYLIPLSHTTSSCHYPMLSSPPTMSWHSLMAPRSRAAPHDPVPRTSPWRDCTLLHVDLFGFLSWCRGCILLCSDRVRVCEGYFVSVYVCVCGVGGLFVCGWGGRGCLFVCVSLFLVVCVVC